MSSLRVARAALCALLVLAAPRPGHAVGLGATPGSRGLRAAVTRLQRTIARWFSADAASRAATSIHHAERALAQPTTVRAKDHAHTRDVEAVHVPASDTSRVRPRDSWTGITLTQHPRAVQLTTHVDTADPARPGGPDAYVHESVLLDREAAPRAVTNSRTVRVRNERGFLDRRVSTTERRLLPGVRLERETREEYRFRDGKQVRSTRRTATSLRVGGTKIPLRTAR